MNVLVLWVSSSEGEVSGGGCEGLLCEFGYVKFVVIIGGDISKWVGTILGAAYRYARK